MDKGFLTFRVKDCYLNRQSLLPIFPLHKVPMGCLGPGEERVQGAWGTQPRPAELPGQAGSGAGCTGGRGRAPSLAALGDPFQRSL